MSRNRESVHPIEMSPSTSVSPLNTKIICYFSRRSVEKMRLPGDKLISSVLVQFLLSPLILITGDGINENVNNGSACNANNSCLQASCWPCHASTIEHPMSTASVSFNVTNPNLMQTGSRTKQEIDGKFNSHHATIVTPHETHDPSSALRKNASTHHQTPMKKRANQVDIHANVTSTVANDGSKILSRKRRYLIFPPGSSMQIGKTHIIVPF